jgi:hypothetical protein
MAKPIKTWLLETVDGKQVYKDKSGNYNLQDGVAVEFVEGEHPGDDKEVFRKKIIERLGVDCVWVKGPNWTEDQLYG